MIEDYVQLQNQHLVTIVIDRKKTQMLVSAAVESGIRCILVLNGRGILHKEKVGPFTMPGISPSLDILRFVAPSHSIEPLMAKMIHVGKLTHFGAGAIYTVPVGNTVYSGSPPFSEITVDNVNGDREEYTLQEDLTLISCICQRGHAEEIAHSAMASGSPSPIIRFGYGHGIRDRLNFFLQLAINPNKEVIQVVVGAAESEKIFDSMVESGELEKPGKGIVTIHPVEKGLINTMSYQNTSPYPATMEQIIKAVDRLEGNTNWRKSGTVQRTRMKKRKSLRDLVDLTCVVRRGFGDICSAAAMDVGAGGTSTSYATALPFEMDPAHVHALADEREMISLTLGRDQVEKVIETIAALPEIHGTPVLFYSYPTPLAITYLK